MSMIDGGPYFREEQPVDTGHCPLCEAPIWPSKLHACSASDLTHALRLMHIRLAGRDKTIKTLQWYCYLFAIGLFSTIVALIFCTTPR